MIEEKQLQHHQYWRGAQFTWKRWTRPHDTWTHDHCLLCSACICDHRDRDPYDKPGPVTGGHYRFAYWAEDADGIPVWVCRTCFKRAAADLGWTRRLTRRASSSDDATAWDAQTERDINSGRLRSLADKALHDHKLGRSTRR